MQLLTVVNRCINGTDPDPAATEGGGAGGAAESGAAGDGAPAGRRLAANIGGSRANPLFGT